MSRNKVVWLDAGHGGRDPGAVGHGLRESDIVLEIALRCEVYLKSNYSDVDVRQSRTTDVFVELAERTRMANAVRADIFVSIHNNSFTNAQANGFETFIFNGSICENSQRLQREIHSEIWSFLSDNGVRSNRGMRQANFHVLRESVMPSVLTEVLFMSNPEILKFNNDAFLQGVAVAHAVGIAAYLGLKKKSGRTHTVAVGDTLSSIARQFNVSVSDIATANNLPNPDRIAVGDVLIIPSRESVPTPQPSQPSAPAPQTHVVQHATPGFANATDAVNNRNRRTTVQPGTYHIFNTSQGMINVTTRQGTPGSWINPGLTMQQFFPATQAGGSSLVDALNAIGVDSSFVNRRRIAAVNGMPGNKYTGAPQQNTQLLSLLRAGRLVRP